MLKGCGEKGTFLHSWWDFKVVQPLWKTLQRYIKKLRMKLPYDPAIPLFGIYPKNMKTLIQKKYAPPCSLEHIWRYGNNLKDH